MHQCILEHVYSVLCGNCLRRGRQGSLDSYQVLTRMSAFLYCELHASHTYAPDDTPITPDDTRITPDNTRCTTEGVDDIRVAALEPHQVVVGRVCVSLGAGSSFGVGACARVCPDLTHALDCILGTGCGFIASSRMAVMTCQQC